jgi:hypothetical protein
MRFLFAFFLGILFSGCGLIDKPESQPAYIVVDEVKVKLPNSEAFESHDIIDLWSYLDSENLGIFPIPTHIPCLPENEEVTVSFLAGIRSNGIASSVSIYPMLDPVEYKLIMEPGETYAYVPEFKYNEEVKIRFNEGFELSSDLLSYDSDDNPYTNVIKDYEVFRSGSAAGRLDVPDSLDFVEVATADAYPGIPTNGTAVYMELDYMSEADVYIGIIGYENADQLNDPRKTYYLGLKPSAVWKKIYVDLTTPMVQSELAAYRLLFRAENRGSAEVETFRLDNVKLLHF